MNRIDNCNRSNSIDDILDEVYQQIFLDLMFLFDLSNKGSIAIDQMLFLIDILHI